MGGHHCAAADRPTWTNLALGMRPPELDEHVILFGEFQHGWQYYASRPQHKWWGLLGIGLQSAVARAVLREEADLPTV
eukprot:9485473-Pyramimonas_sp.AAC.1